MPTIELIIGAWGLNGDAGHIREVLEPSGADAVTTTLTDTRARLTEWLPALRIDEAAPPAPSRAYRRPPPPWKLAGAHAYHEASRFPGGEARPGPQRA